MVDRLLSIGYRHRSSAMLKAFIFDLGNVLLPFSHEQMYAQVAVLCGGDAIAVRRAFLENDLAMRFERGNVSEEELRLELERRLDTQFDGEHLERAIADIFSPDFAM